MCNTGHSCYTAPLEKGSPTSHKQGSFSKMTVISVFTAVIAAQFDVISAAKLANKAAGIVVGKIGTATVSVDELKDSSEELKWKY